MQASSLLPGKPLEILEGGQQWISNGSVLGCLPWAVRKMFQGPLRTLRGQAQLLPAGVLDKVQTAAWPRTPLEAPQALGRNAGTVSEELGAARCKVMTLWCELSASFLSGTHSGKEAETAGPGQLKIDLLDMSMLYVYWISTDG